jgi:transcriptional regulator with XRE-family HTH domain
VDDIEPGSALPQGQRADLPVRRVTVNSIVALNLAYYRKAAQLTQEELGEQIGWGKSVVSTAERSWEAKRGRSFSAEDLIAIAAALRIPLAALFLPPEDDGTAFRYVLDMPGPEDRKAADLLEYVFPAHEGDSSAMDAYRKRLIAARASDYGPEDNLVTAAKVLALAQETAEEAIETARGAADETLGIARSETDVILGKAIRQAEQITADARARAQALELDAQERHRQAMMSQVLTREELERRIDDLRAYEREYRSRLKTLLEGQLKDLWAGEMRPQVEQAIEDWRKSAAGSGQHVSAVLLREDGTYDVLQVSPADKGSDQAEEDGGHGDGEGGSA